ncbi:hypothetical protein AYL99_00317 [Fonsecaea erecta]|uniref:Chitin-binding type-1 domain-containing protein n=1 Tax=Fonsecaea erecta TaxID=1367422 RepID=A0A178ZZA1_9EURO|nr:hypothetical protein AYL99_00317 [Fonsecaea erecta]OAP64345.1 hypothetical protein AYL99_00317 [Fonsecaea erecta]
MKLKLVYTLPLAIFASLVTALPTTDVAATNETSLISPYRFELECDNGNGYSGSYIYSMCWQRCTCLYPSGYASCPAGLCATYCGCYVDD